MFYCVYCDDYFGEDKSYAIPLKRKLSLKEEIAMSHACDEYFTHMSESFDYGYQNDSDENNEVINDEEILADIRQLFHKFLNA